MAILLQVAPKLGATPTQVVPAGPVASKPSIIPITGASNVRKLDEQLGTVELDPDEETWLA